MSAPASLVPRRVGRKCRAPFPLRLLRCRGRSRSRVRVGVEGCGVLSRLRWLRGRMREVLRRWGRGLWPKPQRLGLGMLAGLLPHLRLRHDRLQVKGGKGGNVGMWCRSDPAAQRVTLLCRTPR